jgi:RNA polymerase sigma factor (sigma-70 family)
VTHASPDLRIEHLLRDLAPYVLGVVVRRYRDFAAAEDAVQEAMIAAAAQWPRDGVPANPAGWLVQVTHRRMADHVRSASARRSREAAMAEAGAAAVDPDADGDLGVDPDDGLRVLFMCCHPSLSTASAIALTLRAVGGLTTAEIARAFLVPENVIGQRISRAKQSIRESAVPLALPEATEHSERLGAVLHVLYLIFSEGYAASSGDSVHRTDLSNEAIRLTRAVHRLLPHDGEVEGLLALMLLTDARRHARTGPNGELIPLDEQDRARWDREAIAEGVALAASALSKGAVREYQLQAAIAAVHDEAERAEDTDWPQILALYGMLQRLSDNPMVALNLAIATAMVHGPTAGLALLEPLEGDRRLQGNHRLDAVRGHLLERVGDNEGARAAYHRAAGRTTSLPERNYLVMKAARLGGDGIDEMDE